MEAMAKSESATITRVDYGKEDHGILTCTVMLEGKGWGQGFGGLALDETTGAAFVRELCAAFSVAALGDLVGQACTAKWFFDEWNEPVDTLRCKKTGRAFSIQAFREKHWPGTLSPLEQKRSDLAESVAIAGHNLDEARRRQAKFERQHGGARG